MTKYLLLVLASIVAGNTAFLTPNTALESTAANNPVLLKLLQTVDAATTDERLLDVSLQLLKSLCVCMRETLKARQSEIVPFSGDTNSLQIEDATGPNKKVLELYQSIYNKTCFDLKNELALKVNKSATISSNEEKDFILNSNCGKRSVHGITEIYESKSQVPEADQNGVKLEDILYRTFIKTRNYHRYCTRKYGLYKNVENHTSITAKHSIIVILTFYPSYNKSPSLSNCLKLIDELNNTLYTHSPIDIDIIDTRFGQKENNNEDDLFPKEATNCSLKSIYMFLLRSEKNNKTKVFKLLQRKNTIKVYLDIDAASNHTDYTKTCCNNGSEVPMCNLDVSNASFESNDITTYMSTVEIPSNIQINFKDTIDSIRTLVKLYDKKIKKKKAKRSTILPITKPNEINTDLVIENDSEIQRYTNLETDLEENKSNSDLFNPITKLIKYTRNPFKLDISTHRLINDTFSKELWINSTLEDKLHYEQYQTDITHKPQTTKRDSKVTASLLITYLRSDHNLNTKPMNVHSDSFTPHSTSPRYTTDTQQETEVKFLNTQEGNDDNNTKPYLKIGSDLQKPEQSDSATARSLTYWEQMNETLFVTSPIQKTELGLISVNSDSHQKRGHKDVVTTVVQSPIDSTLEIEVITNTNKQNKETIDSILTEPTLNKMIVQNITADLERLPINIIKEDSDSNKKLKTVLSRDPNTKTTFYNIFIYLSDNDRKRTGTADQTVSLTNTGDSARTEYTGDRVNFIFFPEVNNYYNGEQTLNQPVYNSITTTELYPHHLSQQQTYTHKHKTYDSKKVLPISTSKSESVSHYDKIIKISRSTPSSHNKIKNKIYSLDEGNHVTKKESPHMTHSYAPTIIYSEDVNAYAHKAKSNVLIDSLPAKVFNNTDSYNTEMTNDLILKSYDTATHAINKTLDIIGFIKLSISVVTPLKLAISDTTYINHFDTTHNLTTVLQSTEVMPEIFNSTITNLVIAENQIKQYDNTKDIPKQNKFVVNSSSPTDLFESVPQIQITSVNPWGSIGTTEIYYTPVTRDTIETYNFSVSKILAPIGTGNCSTAKNTTSITSPNTNEIQNVSTVKMGPISHFQTTSRNNKNIFESDGLGAITEAITQQVSRIKPTSPINYTTSPKMLKQIQHNEFNNGEIYENVGMTERLGLDVNNKQNMSNVTEMELNISSEYGDLKTFYIATISQKTEKINKIKDDLQTTSPTLVNEKITELFELKSIEKAPNTTNNGSSNEYGSTRAQIQITSLNPWGSIGTTEIYNTPVTSDTIQTHDFSVSKILDPIATGNCSTAKNTTSITTPNTNEIQNVSTMKMGPISHFQTTSRNNKNIFESDDLGAITEAITQQVSRIKPTSPINYTTSPKMLKQIQHNEFNNAEIYENIGMTERLGLDVNNKKNISNITEMESNSSSEYGNLATFYIETISQKTEKINKIKDDLQSTSPSIVNEKVTELFELKSIEKVPKITNNSSLNEYRSTRAQMPTNIVTDDIAGVEITNNNNLSNLQNGEINLMQENFVTATKDKEKNNNTRFSAEALHNKGIENTLKTTTITYQTDSLTLPRNMLSTTPNQKTEDNHYLIDKERTYTTDTGITNCNMTAVIGSFKTKKYPFIISVLSNNEDSQTKKAFTTKEIGTITETPFLISDFVILPTVHLTDRLKGYNKTNNFTLCNMTNQQIDFNKSKNQGLRKIENKIDNLTVNDNYFDITGPSNIQLETINEKTNYSEVSLISIVTGTSQPTLLANVTEFIQKPTSILESNENEIFITTVTPIYFKHSPMWTAKLFGNRISKADLFVNGKENNTKLHSSNSPTKTKKKKDYSETVNSFKITENNTDKSPLITGTHIINDSNMLSTIKKMNISFKFNPTSMNLYAETSKEIKPFTQSLNDIESSPLIFIPKNKKDKLENISIVETINAYMKANVFSTELKLNTLFNMATDNIKHSFASDVTENILKSIKPYSQNTLKIPELDTNILGSEKNAKKYKELIVFTTPSNSTENTLDILKSIFSGTFTINSTYHKDISDSTKPYSHNLNGQTTARFTEDDFNVTKIVDETTPMTIFAQTIQYSSTDFFNDRDISRASSTGQIDTDLNSVLKNTTLSKSKTHTTKSHLHNQNEGNNDVPKHVTNKTHITNVQSVDASLLDAHKSPLVDNFDMNSKQYNLSRYTFTTNSYFDNEIINETDDIKLLLSDVALNVPITNKWITTLNDSTVPIIFSDTNQINITSGLNKENDKTRFFEDFYISSEIRDLVPNKSVITKPYSQLHDKNKTDSVTLPIMTINVNRNSLMTIQTSPVFSKSNFIGTRNKIKKGINDNTIPNTMKEDQLTANIPKTNNIQAEIIHFAHTNKKIVATSNLEEVEEMIKSGTSNISKENSDSTKLRPELVKPMMISGTSSINDSLVFHTLGTVKEIINNDLRMYNVSTVMLGLPFTEYVTESISLRNKPYSYSQNRKNTAAKGKNMKRAPSTDSVVFNMVSKTEIMNKNDAKLNKSDMSKLFLIHDLHKKISLQKPPNLQNSNELNVDDTTVKVETNNLNIFNEKVGTTNIAQSSYDSVVTNTINKIKLNIIKPKKLTTDFPDTFITLFTEKELQNSKQFSLTSMMPNTALTSNDSEGSKMFNNVKNNNKWPTLHSNDPKYSLIDDISTNVSQSIQLQNPNEYIGIIDEQGRTDTLNIPEINNVSTGMTKVDQGSNNALVSSVIHKIKEMMQKDEIINKLSTISPYPFSHLVKGGFTVKLSQSTIPYSQNDIKHQIETDNEIIVPSVINTTSTQSPNRFTSFIQPFLQIILENLDDRNKTQKENNTQYENDTLNLTINNQKYFLTTALNQLKLKSKLKNTDNVISFRNKTKTPVFQTLEQTYHSNPITLNEFSKPDIIHSGTMLYNNVTELYTDNFNITNHREIEKPNSVMLNSHKTNLLDTGKEKYNIKSNFDQNISKNYYDKAGDFGSRFINPSTQSIATKMTIDLILEKQTELDAIINTKPLNSKKYKNSPYEKNLANNLSNSPFVNTNNNLKTTMIMSPTKSANLSTHISWSEVALPGNMLDYLDLGLNFSKNTDSPLLNRTNTDDNMKKVIKFVQTTAIDYIKKPAISNKKQINIKYTANKGINMFNDTDINSKITNEKYNIMFKLEQHPLNKAVESTPNTSTVFKNNYLIQPDHYYTKMKFTKSYLLPEISTTQIFNAQKTISDRDINSTSDLKESFTTIASTTRVDNINASPYSDIYNSEINYNLVEANNILSNKVTATSMDSNTSISNNTYVVPIKVISNHIPKKIKKGEHLDSLTFKSSPGLTAVLTSKTLSLTVPKMMNEIPYSESRDLYYSNPELNVTKKPCRPLSSSMNNNDSINTVRNFFETTKHVFIQTSTTLDMEGQDIGSNKINVSFYKNRNSKISNEKNKTLIQSPLHMNLNTLKKEKLKGVETGSISNKTNTKLEYDNLLQTKQSHDKTEITKAYIQPGIEISPVPNFDSQKNFLDNDINVSSDFMESLTTVTSTARIANFSASGYNEIYNSNIDYNLIETENIFSKSGNKSATSIDTNARISDNDNTYTLLLKDVSNVLLKNSTEKSKYLNSLTLTSFQNITSLLPTESFSITVSKEVNELPYLKGKEHLNPEFSITTKTNSPLSNDGNSKQSLKFFETTSAIFDVKEKNVGSNNVNVKFINENDRNKEITNKNNNIIVPFNTESFNSKHYLLNKDTLQYNTTTTRSIANINNVLKNNYNLQPDQYYNKTQVTKPQPELETSTAQIFYSQKNVLDHDTTDTSQSKETFTGIASTTSSYNSKIYYNLVKLDNLVSGSGNKSASSIYINTSIANNTHGSLLKNVLNIVLRNFTEKSENPVNSTPKISGILTPEKILLTTPKHIIKKPSTEGKESPTINLSTLSNIIDTFPISEISDFNMKNVIFMSHKANSKENFININNTEVVTDENFKYTENSKSFKITKMKPSELNFTKSNVFHGVLSDIINTSTENIIKTLKGCGRKFQNHAEESVTMSPLNNVKLTRAQQMTKKSIKDMENNIRFDINTKKIKNVPNKINNNANVSAVPIITGPNNVKLTRDSIRKGVAVKSSRFSKKQKLKTTKAIVYNTYQTLTDDEITLPPNVRKITTTYTTTFTKKVNNSNHHLKMKESKPTKYKLALKPKHSSQNATDIFHKINTANKINNKESDKTVHHDSLLNFLKKTYLHPIEELPVESQKKFLNRIKLKNRKNLILAMNTEDFHFIRGAVTRRHESHKIAKPPVPRHMIKIPIVNTKKPRQMLLRPKFNSFENFKKEPNVNPIIAKPVVMEDNYFYRNSFQIHHRPNQLLRDKKYDMRMKFQPQSPSNRRRLIFEPVIDVPYYMPKMMKPYFLRDKVESVRSYIYNGENQGNARKHFMNPLRVETSGVSVDSPDSQERVYYSAGTSQQFTESPALRVTRLKKTIFFLSPTVPYNRYF